jgi:sphingomyelin phosphodiesterase 2
MGKSSSSHSESRKSVKLLTFNTWGLKFVSKHRTERLQAIADRLAQYDNYDIVALQEVWCEGDWKYIDDICEKQFPYRRIFKSGIVSGPGLAVLSKIPISETFLYRFPINGRPSAVLRGDWFVGKSIAVTLLDPHEENAVPIALLNSHMHAPYAQSGDNSYSCHRACQAWDFAKMVRMLKKAGYAVIQVGDLNSKPGSLPHKLFTVEGGLTDSWDNLHGNAVFSPQQIASMSPADQIELAGITCDSQLNTWRAHRQIWEACRLDYVLVDVNNVQAIKGSVEFTERLPPPLDCSYSDHFAYCAEFLINSRDDYVPPKQDQFCTERMGVYRDLLMEIGEYRKYTIPYQATWRKYHFFASIFALIFLHMAISLVSTPWILVIIMLLGTVIGITGAINGLLWYCGVRSELRALQEVQMEVEDSFEYLKRK